MGSKYFIRAVAVLLPLFAHSCNKDSTLNLASSLREVDPSTYYTEEIISGENAGVYGIWKLDKITGGFSGAGYENTFDFLEIKKIGIYGLVDDSRVISRGKIDTTPFDAHDPQLQFTFVPDQNENATLHGKFFPVVNSDGTLDLRAQCCDLYNFHFVRIR